MGSGKWEVGSRSVSVGVYAKIRRGEKIPHYSKEAESIKDLSINSFGYRLSNPSAFIIFFAFCRCFYNYYSIFRANITELQESSVFDNII